MGGTVSQRRSVSCIFKDGQRKARPGAGAPGPRGGRWGSCRETQEVEKQRDARLKTLKSARGRGRMARASPLPPTPPQVSRPLSYHPPQPQPPSAPSQVPVFLWRPQHPVPTRGRLPRLPRASDFLSQPDSAGAHVSWLARPQKAEAAGSCKQSRDTHTLSLQHTHTHLHTTRCHSRVLHSRLHTRSHWRACIPLHADSHMPRAHSPSLAHSRWLGTRCPHSPQLGAARGETARPGQAGGQRAKALTGGVAAGRGQMWGPLSTHCPPWLQPLPQLSLPSTETGHRAA